MHVVSREIVEYPVSLSVPFGATVRLHCKVASYPPLQTVSWYKGNKSIATQIVKSTEYYNTTVSSTFTISSANVTTAGDYYCASSHTNPATILGIVMYRVCLVYMFVCVCLVGAAVTSSFPRIIVVPVGRKIYLSCSAKGSFPLELTWGYSKLSNSSGFRSFSGENATVVPVQTGVIGNISLLTLGTSTGYYRCEVKDATNVSVTSLSTYLNVTCKCCAYTHREL